MKKLLSAHWFVAAIGGLSYLGTTAACFTAAKFTAPEHLTDETGKGSALTESWNFYNPEMEQMVQELKRERESLSAREQQLKELEVRLGNERQEIGAVTQMVSRLQRELEQSIVRVKQEEVPNLKKLAKIHAAMSPEGSANILKEQTDEEVLKMFFYLKPAESGPILEAVGKLGKTEAKRAAELSERLRRTIENGAQK